MKTSITIAILCGGSDTCLWQTASQSQHVKKIATQFEKLQRGELTLHRKVQRPWGWYDSIDESERFKVKSIQGQARCHPESSNALLQRRALERRYV